MKSKKAASAWWVAFFHAATSILLTSTVLIGATLFMSYGLVFMLDEDTFNAFFEWSNYTLFGKILFEAFGFAVFWFAIRHQARYTSRRYAITDVRHITFLATVFTFLTFIPLYLYDWLVDSMPWRTYSLAHFIEALILDGLFIALFFFATKRYLKSS